MSRLNAIRCLGVLVALVVWGGAGKEAEAQFRKGFTRQTREVTLNRKRPPNVYLMATDVAVKATAQTREAQALTDRLSAALQAELLSNDPRLKPSSSPGTIISCAIGRVETSSTWVNRKVTVSKYVGDENVWNDKKKQYEKKAVYRDVEETQRVQVLSGGLNISYEVADKSGAVLDSDTITASFNREAINGEGAPTTGAIEQSMMQSAIAQIVPRIVPTTESVKVLLARPNDQVDDLNKLAEAGLWSRMLEQLELMKPIPDRGKEAYRQYNIGVANEALAYQTEDVPVARKLLEQAALQYGKALEMKPDERYFREPQARIDTAIAAYQKLEQQRAAYESLVNAALAAKEAAAREAAAKAEGARDLEAKKTEPKPLSNADIIELAGSGLDHENLVATIKGASAVAFDLSPAGLKELLSKGISNQVISVMRTKQQSMSGAKKPATPVKKTPTPVKKQG